MASPQLQTVMTDLATMGLAFFTALGPPTDIAALRASMRPLGAYGAVPDSVAVTPVDAGGVRCEWLLDAAGDPRRRLVYLHGGGYVGGDIDIFRAHAARLAWVTGCAVLNVEYRLAPEHRVSDARDDAVSAYAWALGNGPHGPDPARRMFIAGDSAGGGLTLASTYAIDQRGVRHPDALVTVCAAVNMEATDHVPEFQLPLIEIMKGLFLRDVDRRDPVVSPIFGNLACLPPTLIQVGGAELALVENVRFHERAMAAGVATTFELWPEMPHDWHLFAPVLPEANAALEHIATFLRRFT